MSVDSRAFALDAAVKLNLGEAAGTLNAANEFLAFLTGSDVKGALAGAAKTVAAAKTAAATPAKKTTKGKTEDEVVAGAIADAAEAEEAVDADTEVEEEVDETGLPATKEGAQAGVARLLKANKRKEAVALLKKYGSKSISDIKPSHFAKFVKEVEALLPKEPAEDDLTA